MHKDQTKFQINGDNGKLLKNPDSKKDINDHVDEDDASRDKSVEQQGLPVDRGWAWVVVVAAWCNFILTIGSYKAFGMLFIEIQDRYGSSSSMTSLIASVLNGTYSVTALLVTTIGLQYFSSRQFIVLGGIIMTSAYVLSAFAPSVEILILLLGCVSGIAHGMITAPTMALISQYFEKYRSLANCIATTGGSVGSLLFSVLIPYLIDEYAFSGTVMLLAGIMLHLTVSGMLMRPITFYSKHVDKIGKTLENGGMQDVTINGKVKTNGSLKNSSIVDRFSKSPDVSITRSHLDLRNGHSSKGANSPLIDAKLSPFSMRKAAARNRRKRTISELSRASISHRMENAISALNNSSIGRYASTELSFSSMLDLTTNVQQKNADYETKDQQSCICCQKGCSKFGSIIDCKALKSIPFLFFIPCGCLIIMISAVGIYLPAFAKDLGVSSKKCGLLITIISIVDICACIMWGVLADRQYIRRHKILSLAVVCMGIATSFSPLFTVYTSFVVYSVIYGIFGRVYFSLYPVILVDFNGLENLRSALGVFGLAQTGTSAALQPIIGMMRDKLGSYVPGMLLISALITIGGLWVLTLPFAERLEKRKKGQLKQNKEIVVP
ncbi:monocarboxylate transporter 5-like [Ruditapes philippinarum]|uniref:monocarboxylate transporter 5-like n=1 Tax=Ruditapes philippinarum TaxID=129788 RepID=UPI00295B1849|nr:monocarboxylate transporter 5-like [Ruditapes philippinarum]